MKKIYTKHNSFFGLRLKEKNNNKKFISNLKLILDNEKNYKNLNLNFLKIFKQIKSDLFKKNIKKNFKFKLTPNVIQEINSLDANQIPRYLIHRYRYEIYPQIKIHDNFPPLLQIEPTSICNYRCVFCYQTDNKFNKRSTGFMGHMKLETFKSLIDQAEGNIEFITLASRGEPLLCPDFKKMIAYTREKFLNLKINTNASLMDESMSHEILKSGIKTVVFSADSADSKSYSKLRVNGKLEKIFENIKNFKKIKEKHYSNSRIITRVSGVKVDNQQNLNDMEKYWGELVDQVTFVNYIPWENVYETNFSEIKLPCSDLWRRMFVWWDGKINPCDVDYKSKLSPGKLKESNISSLWNSAYYNKLRQDHISKRRDKILPCNKCNVV